MNIKNSFKITCPHCTKSFSADDFLKNHIEEHEKNTEKRIRELNNKVESEKKKVRDDYNKKLEKEKMLLSSEISKKLEKDNKIQLSKLNNRLLKAENEKKKIEGEYTKKLEKEKTLIEKELTNQISEKLEKDNKTKLSNLNNRLSKAENEKKKIEEEYTKKLEKEKTQISSKHQMDLERKDKEMEILKKRQQKKVGEMEKQLKQKSVEVQGEIQEELLEDFLRRKFPQDRVEAVNKGVKGGDCILSINNQSEKDCAKIYFESKDHKNFKEDWVDKLLKDMKEKNIGYGVIVTRVLPKTFGKNTGIDERHGNRILIIPMNYEIIHTAIKFIREKILNIHINKKENVDVPKEMKRLWDHMTGPGFQLPIRSIYSSMKRVEYLVGKDKKFFEKNQAKKENAVMDMQQDLKELLLSFTKKVGDGIPTNLLENEDEIKKLIEEGKKKLIEKGEKKLNNKENDDDK